jgi:spermidine/putrescine transport system substrate-binding protein
MAIRFLYNSAQQGRDCRNGIETTLICVAHGWAANETNGGRLIMVKAPFPIVSRRRLLKAAGALSVLAAWPQGARAEEEKRLNFYNWDTYTGETTLQTFTDRTGIEVQLDLYANNEELYAKLKEGNPGYDVIVPSDYMVETMLAVGLLEPLDHSKIPNIANIDPRFTDPKYDPGMKHSLPYMWGTLGIGYRKSKVSEPPTSWKVLFDSDEYSGRIALLADQRAVIGIALKYLGFPMNSTNADEIAKARDLIIQQKPHIKAFAPDEGQNMLVAGDVDVVMEWNGDIIQVMEEDDDLDYAVPAEGTNVWTDSVAIPKDAPHPENAHAFLNHIHDKEVMAEIANTIRYATSNAAARELVNPEDLANPRIYPAEEIIAKSESLIDVGDSTRLYDDAWTAIQAA